MNLYSFPKFLSYLEKKFPQNFSNIEHQQLVPPQVFSPFFLELPQKVFDQAQLFISEIYKIKSSQDYQNKLDAEFKKPNISRKPALLTCFDFHYSNDMGLKLIEINTNASLYPSIQLYQEAHGEKGADPGLEKLLKSFQDTFKLQEKDEVGILDFDPSKEGLYFEFLIYKEWLERNGYSARLLSLEQYNNNPIKNIYNRYTDFYFEKDGSEKLKENYNDKISTFSPHPYEYFLIADKKRLNLLRSSIKDAQLATIIPESKLFSEFESKDELWSKRKKYFLKPSNSFGSKGVYSGKGISKKAFESIYSPDFMAQELCPAGKKKFVFNDEEIEMKFDLRFYTFEGEVQNFTSRIYQGQATNMRTKHGGLAPIRFI